MEVIQVYNAKDDIILYQQISNVLSGIGYYSKDVQPSTWAGLEGHYRIGVLEGTTGTGYKAKYIGAAAKERYRSERIEELKKQIDVLEKQIKQIEWDILKNKEQQKTLQEEMDKFPDAEDLKIAAKDLWDSKSRLDTAKETAEQYRERLLKEEGKLKEIQLKVQEICVGAHMANRLDVFESALKGLKEYYNLLSEAGITYNKYWSGVGMLKTLEDSLEGLIEDRDEILYTLNQYNQRKARTLGELESVRQQLGLTNYNEIKERLDTCVKTSW